MTRNRNFAAASSAEIHDVREREIAILFQEPVTELNAVTRIGRQSAEAIRTHESKLSKAGFRARGPYPRQLVWRIAPAHDDDNSSSGPAPAR
jgi:ABC-type dipeptide/oligopeptide/nickel transport system ATPase component